MATKETSYLPFGTAQTKPATTPKKSWLLRGTVIATLAYLSWKTFVQQEQSPPLGIPDSSQRAWGQYAPYFQAAEYSLPPSGCAITQVNILHRHGARYPNEGDGYDDSVDRLIGAKKFKDNRLEFLKSYSYDLGKEDLTPFGATQSFESGVEAYQQYFYLFDSNNIPFIRASGIGRVVDSARNWSIGFTTASSQQYHPEINVVIPEDQNNTLKEDCPRAGDGKEQKDEWLNVFAPPIADRLNKAAPGAGITNSDVFHLMAMCPFETIAKQRPSEFCRLFTDEEFLEFEYHGDVEKYYKTGYGEALGPIQGVGYLNELLARLTNRPVSDHTKHNSTYPFPLSRPFYIDFTHENLMVAVYSAMGLFNITRHPLDPKKMHKDRTWVASKMVPFSSRMVVEKMSCMRGKMSKEMGEEYVRVFVNNALQPLEFCGAKKGGDGLCTLEAFVESQGYARRSGDGDFEKCY
ncbi:acid phosphatase [Cristinia sonorae]|uniref:Phytase A n=1 Tax=Cristinia sonorae TaxID=1940300 RepID=A0A8K0XKH4_9AGAR|nr:acid phosphatase [Cristinia sonorae]